MPSKTGLLYQAIAALALVSQGVLAQDDDVKFTYPDKDGLTFYQRDAVTVSYISNIKNASLWTFCREGKNGADVVFKGRIDEAAPMNGSQEVRINFNTNSDNCWFNLRNNDEDGTGFNSPRFSLSSDERSQTTLGLEQETAQTTSAPPSTSETTTSTSISTSSGETSEPTRDGDSGPEATNSDSAGDSGLSTGAKAGIGVGVALGVLGIAAFIGVFFMLRRRRERNGPGSEQERQELHGTTVVEHKANWGGPPVDHGPPQEMSAGYEAERRAGAHEMPG